VACHWAIELRESAVMLVATSAKHTTLN